MSGVGSASVLFVVVLVTHPAHGRVVRPLACPPLSLACGRHRKGKGKGKGKGKKVGSNAPRELGPTDTVVHTRDEGLTVQLCGDSEVVGKWINGKPSLGQKYHGKFSKIQKKNAVRMIEKEGCKTHIED